MSTTTRIKGEMGTGALLHKLQRFCDGVAKHQKDPGFPPTLVSAASDLQVEHDRLGPAAEDAIEKRALAQKAHGVFAADRTQALVEYRAAVRTLLGYLKSDKDPQLKDYGITPYKPTGRKKGAKSASAHHAHGTAGTPPAPSTSSGSTDGAAGGAAAGGSESGSTGSSGTPAASPTGTGK